MVRAHEAPRGPAARVIRTVLPAVCFFVFGSCAHAMQLTSPSLASGGSLTLLQVSNRCGGQNHSPALAWSGAPSGTRSLALTLFDRDANGGRGFWHWLVVDIPASTQTLAQGARSGNGLPAGAVQAENDFGDPGYGGACPPRGSGLHHYVFTLYALDSAAVPVESHATGSVLAPYLTSHALATAALVGVYSR